MLERYLDAINTALDDCLELSALPQKRLYEAMRYSALGSGKRMRPSLTLAFCESGGGTAGSAMPFACAIELIHAYSLIHDDLPAMDDDALRRGQPTCHVKYDEATAILAGDALLTLAFETASQAALPAERVVTAIRTLAVAAGAAGMVGGQLLDMTPERITTPEEHRHMQQLKTGRLISCAAELGCIAAGADAELSKAASAYTRNLALAFQLRDDLLNEEGDSSTMGKPCGTDSAKGKRTYKAFGNRTAALTELSRLVSASKSAIALYDSSGFMTALADSQLNRVK